MKITAPNLTRWAGLAAMLAGISYMIVGFFHPLNILPSVTTTRWVVVHIFASAMSFFGLLGMAGLYARQVEKSGWLGLVGYILLSVWMAIILGFTFVEIFILPPMVALAPWFVQAFLGAFAGTPTNINLGVIPTLWQLTGPMYILGGLLFGISTFRAGILSRWAGAALAIAALLVPAAALVPPTLQPILGAVPVGFALAWLGYSLLSEQRVPASEPLPVKGSPLPSRTGAD